MIEISNLTRRFGELVAVDNLSFRINDGEIFGLLGPNGAGKTTTVKMMVGMITPDAGDIRINGCDIKRDTLKIKQELGYVPESCALYENLTGREHLEMICELYHLPYGEIPDRVRRLVDLLDLQEAANKRIAGYSRGMKQKLLLGSGLIHNPKLLILDEPFSGLDANSQSVFKELVRKFAGSGRIVIFCSHILEVVERVCDKLLIIDHGRKLSEGTPKEIIAEHQAESLSAAFNKLTGATDIDDRAGDILEALERNGSREQ